MDNRPTGRKRIDGGQGKTVGTHGAGLGTGPVGKQDAYHGRTEGGQGGGNDRAGGGRGILSALPGGGKGKLILILIVIVIAVIVLPKLFKGGSGGESGGTPVVSSSGFTGANGAYTGWQEEPNTAAVITETAAGTRAKYTEIKGNGQDTVTLMVYMCGTDLESKHGMGSADLGEMCKAAIAENVNVFVMTGGCRAWKTTGISNTQNQIYKIETGSIKCLENNAGNKAMTDPNNLSDFIKYCKNHKDAKDTDRYMLILWDHGGGTISGYGYDEKNASAGSMTLPAIASALKAGGVQFDFIGFDACLMATLETALVLNPYTDYMIASEETEPGVGWYYTNWLTDLSANTSMETVALGKEIVDEFVKECAKRCPGQKTTLSVIDVAELSSTVGKDLSAFSDSTADLISGSGYQSVSAARANTREFGVSSKIDQVDLVHLALNLGTPEGKALANTLRHAVKYNRTSSNVTDAYGISAYFPYRNTAKVNSAVNQLNAIGMDAGYTACVRKFASLEVTGQATQGGTGSPFGSLFGGSSGTSVSGGMGDIIGALLGGGSSSSSVSGLSDFAGMLGGFGFFDKSLKENDLTTAVSGYTLPALTWERDGGTNVLRLTDEQWGLVNGLLLNVFLDDGKGYIDLGLDNIYEFTKDGALIGDYDGMWVAIDKQPVAYYYESMLTENGRTVMQGRVPVLLDGDRAELLIAFEDDRAYIAGARYVYTAEGETALTETTAKAVDALPEGAVIQPICDRYGYDGAYEDSFLLGDPIVYHEGIEVSDVRLTKDSGDPVPSYVLTDIFGVEHWTPAID